MKNYILICCACSLRNKLNCELGNWVPGKSSLCVRRLLLHWLGSAADEFFRFLNELDVCFVCLAVS